MRARPVALGAVLVLAPVGLSVVSADAATASVRLSVVSRSGASYDISGSAINLATGKVSILNAGSATSLPTGRYVVGAYIAESPSLTVAARTVSIGKSTTLRFDTRKARKVTFDVGDASVRPIGLAVVPLARIKGKDKPFIPAATTEWPAAATYVLPDSAAGVRLGIHGVLGKPGDASPVRYDLVHSLTGMPSGVSFKTTRAKLARVDLTVATLDSAQSSRMTLTAKQKNLQPVVGVGVGAPALGRQVNYRTPGLQWGSSLAMNDLNSSAFLEEDRKAKKLIYAAGKTYREDWGIGVWAATPSRPAIFNQSGTLRIAGGPGICAFSGTGVTLTGCQLQPQTYSYALSRNGKSLGEGVDVATAVDPNKAAWYGATMTASRSGGELATSVSARWYFLAGGKTVEETKTHIYTSDTKVLPGYIRILAKGANSRNLVPGGAKTALTMSVQQFGKVKSMALKYSTDGGKTWKAAKVVRKGAAWVASVPAPSSGAVSLKVTAKSPNGAFVEQTVLNAYGVR